jgi:hypothetical protein
LLLTENHYPIKLATSIFLTNYDTARVSDLQFGEDLKSLFVPSSRPTPAKEVIKGKQKQWNTTFRISSFKSSIRISNLINLSLLAHLRHLSSK